MSANCFVDTNILVYARDSSEPEKQVSAEQWLTQLWQHELGRISTQVMNEYYVTVTQKLKPGSPLSRHGQIYVLLRSGSRWIFRQRLLSQPGIFKISMLIHGGIR